MLACVDNTYGEPSKKIFAPCYSTFFQSSSFDDSSNYILVFEPIEKISLKGKMYDFSQITGYTTSENVASSSTTPSMGSMIRRAALGGALFGGVGAIIGAGTAKTTTEYNTRTTIKVFTNSLSEPCIVLDLVAPNNETVAQIEGILRIITTMQSPKDSTQGQHYETPIKKFILGDFATIKKDKREIIIIGIEEKNGITMYEGMIDDDICFFSENELE